jgi:hypothetical protein
VVIDRHTPEAIRADIDAVYCVDFLERIGGKVWIRSRQGGRGIDFASWTWTHVLCARYRPSGQPGDFYGGAPDWPTAWAYARLHMRNFHGVELGALRR